MYLWESNLRTKLMLKDTKHFQHAMNKNKHYWRQKLREHFGFDVWKLPVCERCEGYALWHQIDGVGVGSCKCGHITKNPLTVEEYYAQGHHVDRTGYDRDAPMIVDRQFTKNTATVYGGEAGLDDPNKKIIVARS